MSLTSRGIETLILSSPGDYSSRNFSRATSTAFCKSHELAEMIALVLPQRQNRAWQFSLPRGQFIDAIIGVDSTRTTCFSLDNAGRRKLILASRQGPRALSEAATQFVAITEAISRTSSVADRRFIFKFIELLILILILSDDVNSRVADSLRKLGRYCAER